MNISMKNWRRFVFSFVPLTHSLDTQSLLRAARSFNRRREGGKKTTRTEDEEEVEKNF